MASHLPKHGRQKAPGNKKKFVLPESTFDLRYATKANFGIVGLMNSQFAEMLLCQEPAGSCQGCGKQNQKDS